MRRILLGSSIIASTMACKAPPHAPDQLEELCSYIFDHAGDEEDEELIAGVENLDTWLSKGNNLEDTLEGYQITNLDQEAVKRLDISNARSVDSLIGAAVALEHEWGLKKMAQTTVVADWGEVVPKNYDEYDRDFDQNPGCFPDRSCTSLEASAYGLSKWAGIIDVEVWNDIQFRWVETDIGWAIVHRSWLTRPARVSLDGIDVFAQYFVAVTLPADPSGTTRVMATWIDSDYGALPVSEDYAKSQIVKSMQNQGEAIDDYLED